MILEIDENNNSRVFCCGLFVLALKSQSFIKNFNCISLIELEVLYKISLRPVHLERGK